MEILKYPVFFDFSQLKDDEELLEKISSQLKNYLENPSFAVPSAYYYYLDINEIPVPTLNNVGTDEEKENSIKIWLLMQSSTMFPIDTAFTSFRQDQIGDPLANSDFSLSVKGKLRQNPEADFDFFEEKLTWIVSQVPKVPASQLITDMYLFPPNQDSDIYEVANTLIYWTDNNFDNELLYKFLADLGIYSLENVDLNAYPLYELFFLLTRFYERPLSNYQQELLKQRVKSTLEARDFIDKIFYYEIYDINQVIEIIDKINSEGAEAAGLALGTHFNDWTKWGDEYLKIQRPKLEIQNYADALSVNFDKYLTWTDDELIQLLKDFNLEVPSRTDYFFRGLWVEFIASIIKRKVLEN